MSKRETTTHLLMADERKRDDLPGDHQMGRIAKPTLPPALR